MLVHIKKAQKKKKKMEKGSSNKLNEKRGNHSLASNTRRRCSSGSSERPESANGARRGRNTKIRKSICNLCTAVSSVKLGQKISLDRHDQEKIPYPNMGENMPCPHMLIYTVV